MLVIHDEQLAKDLQQIAEREHRPVEDVLKTMVEQYPSQPLVERVERDPVKQARYKIFELARQYWASTGDLAKAAMSNEELDEEFSAFDEEGIPRLRSEVDSPQPPVGSLAYAAKIAERGNFRSGNPDLARRSREVLEEHFAEDLVRRTKGENASK